MPHNIASCEHAVYVIDPFIYAELRRHERFYRIAFVSTLLNIGVAGAF